MHPSSILAELSNIRIFILYRLEPLPNGKYDKIPTDPLTGRNSDAQDPDTWMLPHSAAIWAELLGGTHGVGLMISPDILINGKRLFAFDLDSARVGDGWKPYAASFLTRFEGAYVEVSVSYIGLHVIGLYDGEAPDHGVKNSEFSIELYTRRRFIALTGLGQSGSVLTDHTRALHTLAHDFFPPRQSNPITEWTSTPVPQWSGPADDNELLRRMLRSHSARAVFGGGVAFADLWLGVEEVLGRVFPSGSGDVYDRSSADQALFNHLAFWTGSDCARMWRIAQGCAALRREKWGRQDYISRTIFKAAGEQTAWYSETGSRIGAQALSEPGTVPDSVQPVPPTFSGIVDPSYVSRDRFENEEIPPPAAAGEATGGGDTPCIPEPPAPPQIIPEPPVGVPDPPGSHAQAIPLPPEVMPPPPLPTGPGPLKPGELPEPGSYITLPMQRLVFAGMVYVSDIHMVQLPNGYTLNRERFDAIYGGRDYAMKADHTTPSKSPWEVFIGSQLADFPKVHGQFFDPRKPPGIIELREGRTYVNSYVPIDIPKIPGDPTPFIIHVYKLLPRGNDAQLLIWYFAALVQNPGVKFQYAPLLQGVEGNGKTLLSVLIQSCVGRRYTHWPKASELGSKFNAPFYGKILICVEDVHISEAKQSLWETLKPMITGMQLEIEPKGVDKVTREVCFNMVLNTNHKDGIRKTRNDRRIMPLFCAQQYEEDLARDGLTKEYFIGPNGFKTWVYNEGGPIVADYLQNLQIPDEFNPAKDCVRAPTTSSTEEAISSSHGAAEEEIIEAVAQSVEGFRGGWISSTGIEHLLMRIGKDKAVPRRNRRTLLRGLGYVPHPALADGRSSIRMPDGTQPVIYVRQGHPWELPYLTGEQVAQGFLQAQKSA